MRLQKTEYSKKKYSSSGLNTNQEAVCLSRVKLLMSRVDRKASTISVESRMIWSTAMLINDWKFHHPNAYYAFII